MRVGDTIVARSSPPGVSARAIIRLSGPQAHARVHGLAMQRQDADPRSTAWTTEQLVLLVPRVDVPGSSLPLPVLATFFVGPRSATGEDVAEVVLPGNPVLVERVIGALLDGAGSSVRAAEAGEFTARAFLSGRLDLAQAEGIARLIASRSDAERIAAQELASGDLGAQIGAIADELGGLLALTEAGIDFTDQEDVVAIAPADLHARASGVLAGVEALRGGPAHREARAERARVVLVGPPNAGKSTLFNALLGRARAVVSPAAGTTRDVLVEPLDLSADVPGGPVVDLCDLAGLDDPERPGCAGSESDAAAQRATRRAVARADVLVLCDPQGRFEAIAGALPEAARERPRLSVRTKADLPRAPIGREAAGDVAPATDFLDVCALDRWQIPALRRAIADAAAEAPGCGAASGVLPRHRACLEAAHGAIGRALGVIDPTSGTLGAPEIVAACLREGLDALGQITGRTTPDEILGRIFATFCVGK